MQQKHINLFLIFLLAGACLFMGINLFLMIRSSQHLPASSVDDIVSLLAEENIRIDPAIISTKQEVGSVYVCDTVNYNQTVAQLLAKSPVSSAYVIPDGELLIMENGGRFQFGENFTFRFDRDGSADSTLSYFDPSLQTVPVSEEKKKEIASIAAAFLDSGSGEFESSANMTVLTSADTIWEKDGLYYAYCSRSIDGIPITENHAMCVISGTEVVEAYGSWSFLTLGESYLAQLSDLLNILFHVRKEISAMVQNTPDSTSTVTIESIELCYALYFYGDLEDFCLIPCWQVTTDSVGDFVYNAIDATLYTNIAP